MACNGLAEILAGLGVSCASCMDLHGFCHTQVHRLLAGPSKGDHPMHDTPTDGCVQLDELDARQTKLQSGG